MSKKTNEKKNIKIWNSIKTRIVLLVIIAIMATVLTMLLLSVPAIRHNVTELTQNYMNDLAIVTGDSIEREIEFAGAEAVLVPAELEDLTGGISISGMDSSYAYVVAADGTCLLYTSPSPRD